jgi:hypothetical protein
MKTKDGNDDEKVLVSRREWLRLTALAAGSAAGLAVGPESASAAAADGLTYPFIAVWVAITSRNDLLARLTGSSPASADIDLIESLN